MAANGISTLAGKANRQQAKLTAAATKRAQNGTPGFRPLKTLDTTQYGAGKTGSLKPGRPWK